MPAARFRHHRASDASGAGKPHRRATDPASALPRGPVATRVLGFLGLISFSLFILIVFGRIMAPFLMSLLTAAMLAVLVHPLYRLALRWTKHSPTLSALLVTLLVALLVLGPGVYGVGRLVGESSEAYQAVQSWVRANPLGDVGTALKRLPIAEALVKLGMEPASALEAELKIQNMAQEAVAPILGSITGMFAGLAKNALLAAFNLALILTALFFFLKEGTPWLRDSVAALPLSFNVRELMLNRFTNTVRAVVHGIFLSAAAQAVMLGLGLWALRVPLPFLLGAAGFFAALIPLVGPAVIYLPAALWLWTSEARPYAAVALALYGALPVSLIDNFIKPMVIGERTRMPVFFLFLSILGGIKEFGPLGLFLGPVILSLVMALAGVYRGLVSAENHAHGSHRRSD